MERIIFGIVVILAFSGCTQQIQQTDIPNQDFATQSPQIETIEIPQQPSIDSQPVIETKTSEETPATLSLGELAQTSSGLSITVQEVVRIKNCSDIGSCVGIKVKVQNSTGYKLSDSFSGTIFLDGKAKQFEKREYHNCPTEYDESSIFPGAMKEGLLCFSGMADASQEVKIFLNVGYPKKIQFIYRADSTEIRDLKHSISFSITDVDTFFIQNSAGATGTIGPVRYQMKNTGETIMSDLAYEYELTHGSQKIESEKDELYVILEPGETSDSLLTSVYDSIEEAGSYSLRVKVKYGGEVLSDVTYPITVNA